MSSHPQVRLLPATEPLLNALTDSRTRFAELVGSPVPDGWPEFPEAIGFTLQHLRTASDTDRSWSMQFFVDTTSGQLLGSGGFAAPPSGRTVEIGYEIAPEFRGQGFGTAAARALVERAVASGEVDHVLAHTLRGPNASTGVLVSLGFEHTADQEDPDAGVVWEWRWSRPPTPVTIRSLGDTDWEGVICLLRDIVTDGETYAYPADADDAALRDLWHERSPGVTVVAVDDTGILLGSAKSGPNRPGRGAHVATASFIVSPAARGQGVGQALGEWVIAWARERGYTAMQFNAVVETNESALRLWQRLGFEIVGTVPEAFDSRRHGLVGLHVMHRFL